METKINKILQEIGRLNDLDNKPLPYKLIKFNEEHGEFSAEVVKMLGYTHKPFDKEHLKEEMADTLQVLLSVYLDICKEQQFDIQEIFEQILEKNKKWESKIPQYNKKD